MAKTLLNATNEILKRVKLVAGDAAALTTLTDSARQAAIDCAVQVVNEGIDELYTATGRPKPQSQGESTVTLVTGTRAYTLATDLVTLFWPMIDKTNAQYLYEAVYHDLLLLDPEQDDTGLPIRAAIRPTDGMLHLDRAPTSVENGRIYTYQYLKDLALIDAADTVPFSDEAFRAMVPAWVQLWKREQRGEFDGALFEANIGRAAGSVTQQLARTSYNPRC